MMHCQVCGSATGVGAVQVVEVCGPCVVRGVLRRVEEEAAGRYSRRVLEWAASVLAYVGDSAEEVGRLSLEERAEVALLCEALEAGRVG